MILVTGGAGFIGTNFMLEWLSEFDEPIVNVDKLTYAANPDSLCTLDGDARHELVQADICDGARMAELMAAYRPRAVIHFAAESHVDRSIFGPGEFVATNINGSFALLEAARAYWAALEADDQAEFRFLHVSTDEVFGSLEAGQTPFTEQSAFAPNSPYAASKAASDHLVRAYHRTYGLPTLTTNCSNNYGPFQFPEKLIPLVIVNALAGKPLPLYGDGGNVRDWLYVRDHCTALRRVLDDGRPGESYNIGGRNEKSNVEVIHLVCDILDELVPNIVGSSYRDQITYVKDRPGHDRRYAIDAGKLQRELGWEPKETFETGLRKTVLWYLKNSKWLDSVQSGTYLRWMEQNYVQRAQTELA